MMLIAPKNIILKIEEKIDTMVEKHESEKKITIENSNFEDSEHEENGNISASSFFSD